MRTSATMVRRPYKDHPRGEPIGRAIGGRVWISATRPMRVATEAVARDASFNYAIVKSIQKTLRITKEAMRMRAYTLRFGRDGTTIG